MYTPSRDSPTISVLGDLFSLHIQNRKHPHKISFSELPALFMKCHTHDPVNICFVYSKELFQNDDSFDES